MRGRSGRRWDDFVTKVKTKGGSKSLSMGCSMTCAVPTRLRPVRPRSRWMPVSRRLTTGVLASMMKTMLVETVEYESYLPDRCPPSEAVPANLTVIRLVRGETVNESDFVPYYELNPGREWGSRLCQACGLSVYTDLADVKHLMAVNPGLKTFKPAVGQLRPADGVIQATPRQADSHHTWWKNKNANAERLFIIQ